MWKKQWCRDRLLNAGKKLYKKNKRIKGKEIAEEAGLPKQYITWCFGNVKNLIAEINKVDA